MRILELCDRFKCLPDQLMAHDAWLFQLLEIEAEVTGSDVE